MKQNKGHNYNLSYFSVITWVKILKSFFNFFFQNIVFVDLILFGTFFPTIIFKRAIKRTYNLGDVIFYKVKHKKDSVHACICHVSQCRAWDSNKQQSIFDWWDKTYDLVGKKTEEKCT